MGSGYRLHKLQKWFWFRKNRINYQQCSHVQHKNNTSRRPEQIVEYPIPIVSFSVEIN